MAAKLVSMKRSAKDKRKDMGEPCGVEAMAPDYPWGLCVNMDGDELDKLGLKTMPNVGAEFTMTAVVKVTSVNQSASESKKKGEYDESRRITLQITDLALDGKGKA